jgi:hypothetical protein
MAISKIDVTGTTITVTNPNGTITTPVLIGCIQSIGNIDETRAVTKYTCIDNNDSTSALGGIERGQLSVGVFFDPDDTTGQEVMREAFVQNDEIDVVIEFSNTPTGGTHGTQWSFKGQISGISTALEKDNAVQQTFTLEINSEIVETAAA